MTAEELGEITAKQEEAERQFKNRLHVCTAAGCLSSGSDKVKAALEKEVKDRGLEHECKVKGVGCMGLCANGPLVADKPRNVMYQNVTADDAPDIVKSLDTEPVARLECPTEMPFFRRQVKIVLVVHGIKSSVVIIKLVRVKADRTDFAAAIPFG